MIKFNNKDTKEIYIGNKAISEVYCGDKLVWQGLDWNKCITQTAAGIRRTRGDSSSRPDQYYIRYLFKVRADFIDVPFRVQIISQRYHQRKEFYKKTSLETIGVDTAAADSINGVIRYDEFSVYDSSGQEKYSGELTIQP